MTVAEEMDAVRPRRWFRRNRRVDQCLLSGGGWYALDLARATGLGVGGIYVRLAQLEAAGFATSIKCSDGRREYQIVAEILMRCHMQRFLAAMDGAP